MNKKGFTLIELLAVIIILGILMIIAIPSVTRYISDSRKNAYVDTAKQIIGSARNLVNSGELGMYSTDTTYYIDQACIKTENKASSPYGEFVEDAAYVVVTYDGKGYTYYWTSIDDAGQGISKITRIDKLDPDLIESDLKTSDIKNSLGIDGRTRYMVINKTTNCKSTADMEVSGFIDGETGELRNPITYPAGKDRDTVVVGDLVKIDDEEFYVVKRSGDDIYMLAKYNLLVGYRADYWTYGLPKVYTYSSSDEGYGLQNSICIGYKPDTRYLECTIEYDETKINTILANYKKYLTDKGASIKNIRLMVEGEKGAFPYSIVYSSSYWVGSFFNGDPEVVEYNLPHIYATEAQQYYMFGVRPIIVI